MGIGLLLQGDLKGAEYAFTQVTRAEPEYADGWLNVARALIQEGETEAAKPFIREALARNDTLAASTSSRLIEKADGDYAAAIASLERVTRQYPRDRVALNQLARILFLDRRYPEALAVLIAWRPSIRKTCRCITRRCWPRAVSATTRARRGRRNCFSASRPTSPHRRSRLALGC